MIQTVEDRLELINHYCFSGKHSFDYGFRCLVAGAGTGDAVIHLAEQLKHTSNEIVYLDISTASMVLAQERAKIRNLNNITWINDSILNLPLLGIGKFDYINCSGVLHHLDDRVEGLRALNSVLNEDGIMAIMVYGRHARMPVYQIQELMHRVNANIYDVGQKLDNTKRLLACLPDSNLYKHLDAILNVGRSKIRIYGDAEIYDLFLHSQDNPFSIPEIYDWLDSTGLTLLCFVSPPGVKYRLRPESFIQDAVILSVIGQLPEREQSAIAELAWGDMITHTFYVSRKYRHVASPNDLDNVPFLFIGQFDMSGLAKHIASNTGLPVQIKHPLKTLQITPGKYLPYILKYLDGTRSIREIFDLVRREDLLKGSTPDDSELMDEFQHFYHAFNGIDAMLLRDKSVHFGG